MLYRKREGLGKRVLTIAVSSILAVTMLPACAKKDNASVSDNTKATKTSATKTDDKKKIKWKGTISVAPYMFGPVKNDEITPLIEKRLKDYGYDVKIKNVYLENGQYQELLNLRMASDDAPDIFKINKTTFQQFAQQGVLASWDEKFFRKHAPHTAAFIDQGGPKGEMKNQVDAFWDMSKYEGKMACMPLIHRGKGSEIQVIYNTQWLKKLNAKVPETLDDFVKLMYRFKNEDPDGNGKNDTYGLSSTMLNVIFGAYGGFPGFLGGDYGHWYDKKGKLVSADIIDGNKKALKLINKLYADGVIDPEFVTGENQNNGHWAYSQPFINGRIGVTHSATAWTHYIPAIDGNKEGQLLQEFKSVQGKNAEVTVGPWLKGPDGDIGGFLRYNMTLDDGIAYNAKLNEDTKKLAAIFEIMDIFTQDEDLSLLATNGVKGKHYEITPKGYTKDITGMDYGQRYEIGISAARNLYAPEYPLNEKYMTINDNAPTAEYIKKIKSQYKGLSDDVGYMSKVYVALPSQAQYSDELKTYRDETWISMIQGKTPVSDYNSYVKQWMDKGGKVLTDEANDWYASKKK